MKPYTSYKDSGIAWAAKLPSHWRTERAKNIFYREARPVRESDEVITCFRDGQVTLRKNRRTEGFTESLKEIGYQGIRKGDLVIHQMDAFAGSIGISDSDGKGTPVYICCSPKDNTIANNSYFCHVLREMAKTGFIKSLYRGIRERSSDFRFETFAVQTLPIPPIDEQEAIVRFITEKSEKIDRYIAEQERLLAALDELRQAEIARAVTRGLNPDAPLRDSGIDWIGSIPANWDINRIKTHFYHISGNGFKIEFQGKTSGDYPFCKASDINGRDREVNSAANYVSKELAQQEGYNIIPTGSILFAKIGEALKKNHRKINTCDCVVDNNCSALTQKADSNINILYFYYISMWLDMATFDNGGTIPCVNISKLLSCQIPIPPLDEQRAIVEYLDAKTAKIDRMKADIEKQIGLLKEYKQRMISDAVTGKIDVRE